MKKLNKKCFVASAGVHVLLLLVLLVGPAFLMRSEKVQDMPVLDFIPDKLIDEALQGGGNPNVRPPAPQPVTQRPERQPVTRKAELQPVRKDPEPKPVEKTPEPKPEPPPKWKPSDKIKVSNKPIDQPAKPKVALPKPDTSRAFADAAKSIRAATSSTTIEMPSLGVGGGPAYANYAQAIKSIYERNWYPPDESTRDDALVKVQVVIAKNGSVVSAKIISRCGDSAVDGTVDATLRRVTSVPPFPAGAKESTRTYVIGFNLKAKRGLG